MQRIREREDEFADPGFGVGFSEPGKRSWAPGRDFFASTNSDEEVVRELPNRVGDGGPKCHCEEGVVGLRADRRCLDGPDGWEAF